MGAQESIVPVIVGFWLIKNVNTAELTSIAWSYAEIYSRDWALRMAKKIWVTTGAHKQQAWEARLRETEPQAG
jgi:hypothetical protein